MRIKSEDEVRASVVRTKMDVSTGKGWAGGAGGAMLHSQPDITAYKAHLLEGRAVKNKI